ncbi:cytochrome P450 [Nocardia bovistercoris]|uniref:Cytochrome P450 n=1 Tax=Nocardia bovistercoris TaxID=2785916 RepID=A0A931I9F4_9NOCA|nr:cytochrome P450 [Nocardia bovistercoris]MBH0776338.1 cytochrome P450 [Nocardia bovistercoris]
MTATFNPDEELRRLEDDPAAGTAEVYRGLLSQCPVSKVEVPNSTVSYWGAFAYDELISVMRNFRVMSSTVAADENGFPAIVPLFADPPTHSGYRKLLNPNFPPEVVGRLAETIRTMAQQMVEELVELGEVDFAQTFATQFPTRVLCLFLGVPDEDWPVHHRFNLAVDVATGTGLNLPTEGLPAEIFADITPYIQRVIEDHRANPRQDIVSSFIDGRIGDRALEEFEIVQLIIAMMLAGHATTTAALNNAVLRLAQDQELQSYLRSNPERIADAIEESLRIDTPQQALTRKCLADTEIGGVTIPAGDFVLTNYGSANVDPKHWSDPEKFDIDRAGKGHLAFGHGLHQCLGQHLARLDMRIAVEELLARTSSITLAGPVKRRTYPVLAPTSMPVRLHARDL